MQTKVIKISPYFPEQAVIKQAAKVLQEGGLVAFPTETVYGIGANLLDEKAIDRLYRVKKRPRNKAFTLHIANFGVLRELGIDLSERANRIVHKFWPGPLTIIALNKKKEKVGIRMPKNKIALDLITEAAIPVVAPSANISGEKAPVLGKEVISEMKGSIDMILDGGNTELAKESTILDVDLNPFKILREGAISREDLFSDHHVLFICTGNSCRSVMAQSILKKFLKESGLSDKVYVDSAATGTYPGISAAPNTVQVMNEEGVDVSMHRGKGATPYLLRKSDFIFVMEDIHKDIILGRLPGIDSKVRLLREEKGIPDPIGKSIEEYRRVRDIIKDQVENIFLEMFKKEKKK